ncbi:uncharacterized protein BX664DRAFT_359643 [Halteromyces radiatus]|uniref:uncharacterized protein n=1 Tax=Halteromyces radiatus TaxID=101107 RepID=UPI002220EA09|nr:uncharacterized protein BX664DRAFT_359643 [Halteromyces radiatus]KAI8086084.1 hypothetical protein BX664DRAFT_359643 [Halteromyces radiatus]
MEGGGFNFADYPVIVGIDFGTTYSGCCYAFAQNEEVFDIVKWPKQNNNIYPKTPSLALYRKGSTSLVDWGHAARRIAMKPNSQDYLLMSKFKLFLMDDTQDTLPNGLNVIDVIADYLRAFHDHVKSELLKGFAGNYDQSKFRYCLTVPAMWSDRAKAATREAAIRAGLVLRSDHPERLMLISEPEAAALYCEKKSEQFNLAHGQRFMICDAGGGTVDLIVFEIDQKPGQKRTLKEVTNGHGGSCGSAFLDVNMREYIKRKFSHLGSINDTAMEHIMDTFVNIIKPEFDGYEDHFLDLPASMGLGDLTDETIGLENGSICLPAQELCEQVFEPVIIQVLQLIEGQLNQSFNLEAIFLVGGFGQSNYLFRRVEEVFANRVGMIGVPPRGELAVVRGAVYFGLSPQQITERVSRRTYGVETRMIFQQDVDPEEYSVIGVDGRKYCRQRFSVYVQKGQSVKVDECVSKTFVISYPSDTDSDLYAFDGEGPPPRLTSHPSIQKVGHFPIRMPTLEGMKPGEKVNMTIRMYFGLTEIKIECIIKDKIIVFTSAFEASDGSAQEIGAGYVQDAYGAPPAVAMDPYGTPSINASQTSFAGYPPNGGYGGVPPPSSYPPQQPGAYPQSSYAAYPPTGAYPADDSYYQQPYADPQGYPPQTQQQQQQGYYGAGAGGGYPPTSQGYSQQGGYSGYH